VRQVVNVDLRLMIFGDSSRRSGEATCYMLFDVIEGARQDYLII
jgi:hypothetical protein